MRCLMSATHDSSGIRTSRWFDRLRRMRLLLAAAAIVFAGLWAAGSLAALPALAGFVLIAAAAFVPATGGAAGAARAPRHPAGPPPRGGAPRRRGAARPPGPAGGAA